MSGCLYIVGTPIGNLEDISKRALKTLEDVDFIVAEDCRVTLKLLNRFKIKNFLISHHKFSDFKKIDYIVERLTDGKTAALVSDAGMPCICDPGEKLIKICHERGILIRVVPGPCALAAALCFCGLNCSRFTFYGFLSVSKKSRTESLNFLKELPHVVVLYEAPHKLVRTLKDLLKYFGDRKIVIVKEMTKIYESYQILTIAGALKYYEEREAKGEFVLVIEGKPEDGKQEVSLKEALKFAKMLMEKGEKPAIASKKAAKVFGLKKSIIYNDIVEEED